MEELIDTAKGVIVWSFLVCPHAVACGVFSVQYTLTYSTVRTVRRHTTLLPIILGLRVRTCT